MAKWHVLNLDQLNRHMYLFYFAFVKTCFLFLWMGDDLDGPDGPDGPVSRLGVHCSRHILCEVDLLKATELSKI